MKITLSSDLFYNLPADALLCPCEAYAPDGGEICEAIYRAAPGLKDEVKSRNTIPFSPTPCSAHGLPYKYIFHLDMPTMADERLESHLMDVYRSAFEFAPELGLTSLVVPLDRDAPDYDLRLRLATDAAFEMARHWDVDFELKFVIKGLSRKFILAMEKELSPLCDVIDDTAFDTTTHTEYIRQLVADELTANGWNDVTFYRKANIGAVELVNIRNNDTLDLSLYCLMNLLVGLRLPYEQFCAILRDEFGIDRTRNLPAAVVCYFLKRNIYDLSLIDRGLDVFELPHVGNALRNYYRDKMKKENDYLNF